MYLIYDELGDLMRKACSLAEAKYITKIRDGWTYKFIKRKPRDLSIYEDAPF